MEIQKNNSSKIDLGIDLSKVLQNAVENYISNSKLDLQKDIKKLVDEEITKLKPTQLIMNKIELGVIKEKTHTALKKLINIAETESNIYLYGEAGSGKTTLARQFATLLNIKFAHISCSAGMSEAHLLGRMIFDGSYITSEFVDIYENGGVFLLDEIDSADSNTLLVINSALANGRLSIPNRKEKPTAIRHPQCIIIVAGNTIGEGSADYTGRNFMDRAFMDRFALSKIHVEYDNSLEKEIMKNYPAECNKLHKIREIIQKENINKIISTRVFVSTAKMLQNGMKFNEIIETLTLGWEKTEIAKIKAIL